MKISINWLKQLVKINKPMPDLIHEINMKTIGTKEVTDKFIELDMKGYNRADLLSLRGAAYEFAALLESEVIFEETSESDFAWNNIDLPKLNIEIEDDEACPFYALAKIEDLKVEPSDSETKEKLADSGQRSVNNLADITNLIMIEYGQPLHAFDASQVTEETIIVRKAKNDEEIKTLDAKVRKLTDEDLLITDPKKAIGIAGVMGGENTEVTSNTSTILLEAAIFEPTALRKTATRLSMQSEAGKRFYHGLTKKRLLQSLDAAIKQYQKIGGKLTALTIFDKFSDQKAEIKLRVAKTNTLIGLDFTEDNIKALLTRLNFSLKTEKPRVFEVTRPYWRLDINIEEDLIEEVARIYGYDKIPSKVLPGEAPQPIDQKSFELENNLKKQLMHQGMSEIQTYSFYSTNVLNALGWDETSKKFLIKLENPMSKETEYMRMNIWPNLTESAVFNNKSFDSVAIYEIGKTYSLKEGSPVEKNVLSLALINGTDNPILELIKIIFLTFEALEIPINFDDSKQIGYTKNLFHPNKFKSITYKGKQIGGVAELHPQVADNFESKNRIAVCEIDLDKLLP
jgi:phenylalanyl-tRNA synthetase beta chain